MKKNIIIIKSTLAFLLTAYTTSAKVILPSVFSDNMVLQQKTNAAVWGKADPGKMVTVTTSWNKKSYSVKAGQQGNWKVRVATPSYGGPYTIRITDGEALTLKNVLIGEVWICSGQSNMEMPPADWGQINNYQQEVQDANYPNIRLLQAEHAVSNQPLDNAKVTNGGWTPCSPEFIDKFSAVAYFFAREIYLKTGIPIGLIHTSWGGTVAEAWTSANTLKTMSDFAAALSKVEHPEPNQPDFKQQMETWLKALLEKDGGYKEGRWIWADNSLDDLSWKQMSLPSYWEEKGLSEVDGIVWFRKKIFIPASWEGKQLTINLGVIDDNDISFFDGIKMGETEGYNMPRKYIIPASQVKAGTHIITVRVNDTGGGGGFYGNKEELFVLSANGERLALAGDWLYKVGIDQRDAPRPPEHNDGPNRPSVLFNAMIYPFLPFSIRGAIWYQGEGNAERAAQYAELFPAMIRDWRKNWAAGDFPFYFVQLANFKKPEEEPVPSDWAELRDAQLKTLSLPHTGMAVTIDIGDAMDIHPKNKQEVGRRLALIALANTYGKKMAFSGPLFQSQKIEGNKVRLNFIHTDGGLKAEYGTGLTGFAVAGADHQFHWAKAVIEGSQIVISSEKVPVPLSVRYNWANNPGGNLYNGAGLPASPFRTDSWPGITSGKK